MEADRDSMEERVWRRVRGEAVPERPDRGLPGLIAGELANAEMYLALSKRMAGQTGETLRRLNRQAQTRAACLRGMAFLLTGSRPAVRTAPPAREPVEASLRRCYGRALRAMGEYGTRTGDPEYGAVFARLEEEEQEQCRILLELIGSLK